MTISEIENLIYEEALKLAVEKMEIKGHDCIFVDFGDAFGYSVLVFKNGKYIYYANDYELHHGYIIKEHGKEALKDFYIKEMNNKLFRDEELLEDIENYDEYKRKNYFLQNYWIMQFDYLSIFGIGEDAQRKFDNAKPNFPFYSPVSFCYVTNEEVVNTQIKYSEHLESAYKSLKENDEAFRDMVGRELANHEACITGDYTDALQALGMKFEKLTDSHQKIVKEELRKQINNYS